MDTSLRGNSVDLNKEQNFVHRFHCVGVPDRLFCDLAYDFSNYALISASTTGSLLVGGNTLFDPDKTGTGHQPLYYDQLTSLYARYRVHSSTITVELLNATISSHLVFTPTTNGTYPATVNDALESTYTCSMPISSSVFRNIKSRHISTKKIWGTKSIDQDDLYQALYTADPVRLWFWKIQAVVFDGVSSGSLRVNVRVVYHCELFDRQPVTQS